MKQKLRKGLIGITALASIMIGSDLDNYISQFEVREK